jgi:hypothetical protein
MRFLDSLSGNLKSKIQNRKWLGIVAIGVTFAMCGVVAQAQQAKKVHWIGYLSPFDPALDLARSEGIRRALRDLPVRAVTSPALQALTEI